MRCKKCNSVVNKHLNGSSIDNAIVYHFKIQYTFLTHIWFGECNQCLLIEFVVPNLSKIYFVYQKSLKGTFKTGF